MENLFELLASTNGNVAIDFGGIVSICDEIVRTEKFADGLTLYFLGNSSYFISSIYNKIIDSSFEEGRTEYYLLDSLHNLIVGIKIYDKR